MHSEKVLYIYIMRYILLLLTFSFSSWVCSQNANLQSFFIKDKFDNQYLGYVEPLSNQKNVKARIIVFPIVVLDSNAALIEDDLGRNIKKDENISNLNLTGSVSLKLEVNDLAGNQEVLNKLILSFHPEIAAKYNGVVEEPEYIDFPCPELVGDNPITQSHLSNIMAQYSGNNMQKAALYNSFKNEIYLQSSKYKVTPVFPKAVLFKVLVSGEVIASRQLPLNSTIHSGSVFEINIPDNLSEKQYRNILEGEYTVETEFSYLSSKFQSATAVINLKGHSDYFADILSQSISKVSKTSTGFLFWEKIQKDITKFIQDKSNESLNSSNVENYEYVLYDVEDQKLIDEVEQFLFPSLKIDEAIDNHIKAAYEAKKINNDELALLHENYAKILTDNKHDLSKIKQVDVTKALEALAKEDLLGFLSNGFAFGLQDSKNSIVFRKFRNSEFNMQEEKLFTSLIFKSLYQKHLISLSPE